MGKNLKSFNLHDPEGTGTHVAMIFFGVVFVACLAALLWVLKAPVA